MGLLVFPQTQKARDLNFRSTTTISVVVHIFHANPRDSFGVLSQLSQQFWPQKEAEAATNIRSVKDEAGDGLRPQLKSRCRSVLS